MSGAFPSTPQHPQYLTGASTGIPHHHDAGHVPAPHAELYGV
ncbi:hypothetical protein [Streptomyces sp. NBC_00859]|nr:hypothetical protein OG584_03145 [Streptomyces sp. NBC_00859]